ncbi:DUF4179 domain-containing protein [Pradoshia sp. D12]|uniref:DUF4179 domain-containing protein n=1 Tax=Bacillaceae TaxID=186817 RepID=UPI0011262CC0|nr:MULTISPECIES: DUF4179 domain-containing protein [Bacillaceae]QFK70121.1 DUF4179 domain-containing protein [Pradoshia sp. D12]TPF70900.1 DUF4179 domain-containing protein [Bacillus sp. D12]
MDKNTFSNKVNEVDVPKEDVLQSIKMGISRSVEEQRPKKRKKSILKTWLMTTAAAVTLMSSSFIVPSFSRVLADAPIIGGLYATFNDMVGRNLEKQNLVKELNQTFTSNGVDVALTSAYYDGYLIGITFDVKGNLQEKDGYYYALYELFNGDPLADETKELTTLTKTRDGYTGHIRIVYPYKDLPKNDTIPISFEEIGMNKGNWQFDVPVQQNPVEEYVFENKESTNPEGDVVFKVDSVITGKASTAIIYSVTYPKGKLDSSFAMLNVDSNAKLTEEGTSDGKIDQLTNGDETTIVRKLVIPKLLRNTTLTVWPSYAETHSPVEPIIIDIP